MSVPHAGFVELRGCHRHAVGKTSISAIAMNARKKFLCRVIWSLTHWQAHCSLHVNVFVLCNNGPHAASASNLSPHEASNTPNWKTHHVYESCLSWPASFSVQSKSLRAQARRSG